MIRYFEILQRDTVKENRHKRAIVDAYQAFGWLTDWLEKFWGAARTNEEDVLGPLVGLAATCQLVAEQFYGLPLLDTTTEDKITKQRDTAIKVLEDLTAYIYKNGEAGTPMQLGSKDTLVVEFDLDFLKEIKQRLQKVND